MNSLPRIQQQGWPIKSLSCSGSHRATQWNIPHLKSYAVLSEVMQDPPQDLFSHKSAINQVWLALSQDKVELSWMTELVKEQMGLLEYLEGVLVESENKDKDKKSGKGSEEAEE